MEEERKFLETNRLILRPWEVKDAKELYKYAKDPRIGIGAGWKPHSSLEYSEQVIEKILAPDPEAYAIVLKETGLPIGHIGLSKENYMEDTAEIDLWIGAPYWGYGYGTEAGKAVIKHAFEDLHIEKIWSVEYEGNEGSKRVQEKLGFETCLTYRDVLIPELNETRDVHVSRLLKWIWKETQKNTRGLEEWENKKKMA